MLVFGSVNVDCVFPMPALPGRGATVRSEGGQVGVGGKGANAAIAAVRDGTAVTFVGAVGHDPLADVAVAGLTAAGLRLRHMARTRVAETGRAAILLDPKGYTMVAVDHGANRHATAGQVPDAALERGRTLLVALETAPDETATLILRAKRAGMRVVLQFSPAGAIATAALRAVDAIVGNSPDLAWLGEHLGTGNNPASIFDALGGVTTVRMMGTQGAELFATDGFLHMPALPVTMRDSTGAGDCFAGVFAAALSRGDDLAAALRRAAVAAALSTERLGGQATFPDAAAIDARLRDAPRPTRTQAEVQD